MHDRKIVIVTGASSGIGRAVTLECVRKGFAVIAVSRDRADLERVAAEAQEDGGTCVPIVLDVTAPDAPSRIAAPAQTRFGRVDVVVHCAGAATSGLLLDQNDDEIDGQWKLHVAAPLRITRALFPMLRESHGQIFFIGSGLRRVPVPYYGAYCAAKAAVETLAQQLRRELLRTGVAVTFVDPGSVRTNFARNAGIPAYGPSWVPVKPEVVARAIVRAIEKRPWRVLAVPWHTLGAILGEWFPGMTDRSLPPCHPERSSHSDAERTQSKDADLIEAPTCHPERSSLSDAERTESKDDMLGPSFESALEPVSRRMERVKLPQSFLAELLRQGEDVHLGDAAMRWAGMPNKNERAALAEALDALTAGGFLERTGEESWRVLRSAGERSTA
ncbi:MAG TPA: SDR family NAD(P)-dependent oxidoreductase [Candidatus Baltobacteraceae bacterium]|nr:SDR family NAD(P)-dependent oxidoreductase [Candidatus Baltobacteraceae bacterium]